MVTNDTDHPPSPSSCPESLSAWGVLKATFKEWSDDHASRLQGDMGCATSNGGSPDITDPAY